MTGWKSKKMMAFVGRGTGKSVWANMVNELTQPNIQHLTSAQVDNKTWHTVKLNMLTADWVRRQDSENWYEHISSAKWAGQNTFDVEESLYTMLMLKWK